ncbi:MAG: aminotransferase class I/II-fold pyridoxal phosphate-dependent enzyme [Chloroflexota bacterium]|jgi:8-amino-3,8-dideoxy-alpha-D-manno-octulosonate transaminase|nr:aminotransferase class I/II-fold pyridoxal phosphate-dependent enzyme [Chloroflexota bacterium]
MSAASNRLAIDGGQPVRAEPLPPMYPGGMLIGENEIAVVLDVLRARRLFRYFGPDADRPSAVAEFERRFAADRGAEFAVACSSGSGALHVALMAAGVGPGDEVIVPGYSYIATAASVVMAGAVPVIAEVDDSLTLDPEDFARKISPLTAAVMPVHMRGAPCAMDRVLEIAAANEIAVIEDVAQANGATYHGRQCGTLGTIGAFSLQFNKIITTGEGGVVVTHDRETCLRSVSAHDASMIWQRDLPGVAARFPGSNYRMSELVGALALAQLGRHEPILEAMRVGKRRIKDAIAAAVARRGMSFRRLNDSDGDTAVALMLFSPTAADARRFAAALNAERVAAGTTYDQGVPDRHIYRHWDAIMQKKGHAAGRTVWSPQVYSGDVEYAPDMCPRTLDYLARTIQLDVSPSLTERDQEDVINAVLKVAAGLPAP